MNNDDLLLRAIETDDVKQVESLIATGQVNVNARTRTFDESPAIALAARCGHTAIVELLIDAGASIDAVDAHDNTACHVAALRDHADVVSLLLARGAAVSQRQEQWRSAFATAVTHGSDATAIALIRAGVPLDDAESLCRAAGMSTAVIQLLLDANVDISALRAHDGRTACHYAAMRPNSGAVLRMLVNVAHVDMDVRSTRRGAAIHLALWCGREDAFRWLVEAGADLDVRDIEGRTPLHLAAQVSARVQWLLAAGADVHAKDCAGQTACHTAFKFVLFVRNVVLSLLAAGCDVDMPDGRGQTVRQLLVERIGALPPVDEIAAARREIGAIRLGFVRDRAFQVCVGLRSLDLDALQMCEILLHACGPLAHLIPFHQWWRFATLTKHFHFEI